MSLLHQLPIEAGEVGRQRRWAGLPKADFDKMIKTAASMLAAKSICFSLGISAEEEDYRFGFAG